MITDTVVSRKTAYSRKGATPYFWPNFLYRVKVHWNERQPWSELRVEFEKHGLERYAYLSMDNIVHVGYVYYTLHYAHRRFIVPLFASSIVFRQIRVVLDR